MNPESVLLNAVQTNYKKGKRMEFSLPGYCLSPDRIEVLTGFLR